MMFHFKTRFPTGRLRRGGAASLLALTAAGLAGCGGVGGNSAAARIRAVDAAVNAGTANILINSASANGDQQAFTTTSVSPYLYISGNRDSSFSYNTSVTLPIDILTPTVPSLSLDNGQFYSAFFVGRADVSPISTPGEKAVNDPRFLQVIVTKDSHDAPASGSALVRVVDAAPDGGTMNVTVNGTTLSGYGSLSFQEPTTDFLAAPYVNVAAGMLTVQAVITGTTTPRFAPVSVPVAAGRIYTLLLTEPTPGTAATTTTAAVAPTFGLQTITDNG